MRDPYRLLGLSRSASQDDIKKAYRRLVKELHPDVNPGDTIVEAQFKEVLAAYDLLSDPEKRARFDRGEIDADGRERAGGGRANGRDRRSGPFSGFGGQDFFDDLFRRTTPKTKGTDISYEMTVEFADAILGTKCRLKLSNGRQIEVAVPAGTDDGEVLRLKGQGLGGLGGGNPGDALVEIAVAPHPILKRQDRDLHIELPVTVHEAVLGGFVHVPTVDGRVSLRVPAGSNAGTVFRLKGKGVPDRDTGRRGDQFVSLKIVLPEQSDPALRDFLSSWKPAAPYEPRRKAGFE